MITNGIVTATERDMATVEAVRQSACDGCHSKKFCLTCTRKKISVQAYNAAGAKVGDRVCVESPSGLILGYAAAVFLSPIIIALAAYLLGSYLFESQAAPYLLSLVFFVLSFLGIYVVFNKREGKKKDTLTIVKIIEKDLDT